MVALMKIRLAAFITILLVAPIVTGQDNIEVCETNRNSPPAGVFSWSPDAKVKVYFQRGTFAQEQRAALLEAMDLWTKTAHQTAAGVTFTFEGEVDGSPGCRNCLIVSKQSVRKYNKYFAFFAPVQRTDDGGLITAWIVFDEATVSPQALQLFMIHELGHGLGLGDCPSCKKRHTVMRSFRRINKAEGVIEPSGCDLDVVRQVYELRRRVATNGDFDAARD